MPLATHLEKPKILVVDDEEVIRTLLQRTLSECGYNVLTSEDGNLALQEVKRSSFNILITDLKMPSLSGMGVLHEIKKLNPYVEVIVITGYPTVESAVEAIKIGAFDYICKPFDIQAVESVIERCIERQKSNLNHFELSEVMTLFETSKALIATDELHLLLERMLDSALALVKAKKAVAMLLDEKTGKCNLRIARSLNGESSDNSGNNISAEAQDDFMLPVEPPNGISSFITVTLRGKSSDAKERIMGVMTVSDKVSGENFTEREQTLLSVLAGQTAAAIENNKLCLQLQEKIGVLQQTIKKLQETQNQLIQSEKMAAVGQLAFGIAHEIRNPLGIILSGIEFLKNCIGDKDKPIADSVGRIKQSIERANRIVVELLNFSRASSLNAQSVDFSLVMDEAVALLKNQAYLSNVKIVKNYPQQGLFIEADPAMLRQAFFNLCMNALDAMPEGGELTLSIYPPEGAEQPAGRVTIEIQDTGLGIPEEILPKIFTPFFTTKEPGKGTGLGLSIVHLILERHNATINVESKVTQGSKFTIKLPVKADSGVRSVT